MSSFNLPEKLEYQREENKQGNNHVDQIKNTISECTDDITKVSNISTNINAQGGLEGFFNKGGNIRTLANNLVTVSSVQQRTLDMVVLLLGAAGRMKTDYDVILESIDELSKSHSGSVEVLEYLVKIKNTVNEIKRRDDLLESLITYSNELRNSIEELDNYFKDKIKTILADIDEIKNKQSEILRDINQTKRLIEKKDKHFNERIINTHTEFNDQVAALSNNLNDRINKQKDQNKNISNKALINRWLIIGLVVIQLLVILFLTIL